jgi:hypothetical protein
MGYPVAHMWTHNNQVRSNQWAWSLYTPCVGRESLRKEPVYILVERIILGVTLVPQLIDLRLSPFSEKSSVKNQEGFHNQIG